MNQAAPYVYTLLGLVGGLSFLLFQPLSGTLLNYVVGGALLVVAVGSVTYMIAQHSGPGERGPDF